MSEHQFDLSSVTLTAESLADFDCVLLATDYDKFDYAMIKKSAKLIGASRDRYLEPSKNMKRPEQ